MSRLKHELVTSNLAKTASESERNAANALAQDTLAINEKLVSQLNQKLNTRTHKGKHHKSNPYFIFILIEEKSRKISENEETTKVKSQYEAQPFVAR